MLNYRKQSGSMRFRLLPLLMGFLLMGVLGFSTAKAAVGPGIDTVGSQAKLVVKLQNKNVQDSVVMPTFKIVVSDTLAYTSDSVAIGFGVSKFHFAQSGPYKVVVNGNMTADSARVSASGDSLYIKISGDAGHLDTLTISGVYILANHTSPVYSDSSTTDFLNFTVGDGATRTHSTSEVDKNFGYTFVLLPGSIFTPVISTPPAGTVAAGAAITATLSFTDKFGNVPNDKATSIGVAAVLNGSNTPGNGTLSGLTTITKTATLGHPGVNTYQWTALSYTRAEDIQLVFTAPGGSVTSGAIIVTPSLTAAHISVNLNKSTIDVNGTITATLTVTDANFNPISGAAVVATENTMHGGTFSVIAATDAAGQTSTTFTPSKFFTGADTLVYTSGAAVQTSAIQIGPGAVGGIIVDYSGTANGSMTSEAIAAGETVYARGFLRDTYGNPVNATSASEITFSVSSVLGKDTKLGTATLTNAITESQYPNSLKTAVGVAIPFTVSTNYRAATQDTVLATTGVYSLPLAIQNRSNVPVKLAIQQTTGADSSVVASVYSHSIAFTDTAWDTYGNLSVAPDASWKIAPTHSSYAIVFSTNGLTKFVGADTIAVDTVYPNANGQAIGTIFSGKLSGIDTIKTWASASNSVSTPVWVTPAAYASLVISPAINTTAIAGQTSTLTIEKQDAFGNHIDWGLAGGDARGNSPSSFTKPTAAEITADSSNLTVDTVTTGVNRGGSVTHVYKTTGKAGVASVGGTLDMTFPFTAFVSSADTQKVYASLGGFKDTSIVYSMSTGLLRSFTAKIAASDSVKNAGDSVAVTFTALDSLDHRIYTYVSNGQTLTVNHTASSAIATTDTTYYFSYVNSHGKYVKSKGINIQDTVFNQGQATFYLHKFVVDSINTVSINGGGFIQTASQGLKFEPLAASTAFGYWSVTAPDTLKSTGAFSFTVTPRDKYYNVNNTEQIIVNISSNQTSGFNIGSNPKVITGPTVFDGILSGAKGNMVIYVFNSGNSNMFTQSSPIAINVLNGIENTNELPKEYALMQNYPNPFNPTTLIKYDLPKAGLVTLKVYDLLGREVATLINGNQAAGKYSVQFNASKLASGVYIYRIQSNNFSAVKKLMLLK